MSLIGRVPLIVKFQPSANTIYTELSSVPSGITPPRARIIETLPPPIPFSASAFRSWPSMPRTILSRPRRHSPIKRSSKTPMLCS